MFFSIFEVCVLLRSDMIFLKNKDFILEFFMDVINVIDFLVNFELILVEEVWIFKYLIYVWFVSVFDLWGGIYWYYWKNS